MNINAGSTHAIISINNLYLYAIKNWAKFISLC